MTKENINAILLWLQRIANDGCKEARKNWRDFSGESVNWINLCCSEVSCCRFCDGHEIFRVTLSPASPENERLPAFVEQYIEKRRTDCEDPTDVIQCVHEQPIRLMGTDNMFNVFLSHNNRDKVVVRKLARALCKRKLCVWLDEEQLRPGIPWQRLLEEGIRVSASVAVLVGKDGLGPWEEEEMQAALQLAVRNKCPVIPVIMPNAPQPPELPLFLSNRTWVDLRPALSEAGLRKLEWGITGIGPNQTPVDEKEEKEEARSLHFRNFDIKCDCKW